MECILQSTASECGLACVAMISSHHGNHVELRDLRQQFSLSLRGATFADLVNIAGQLGLSSRPLRLELSKLRRLTLPCILHWDMNHFVVLSKARSKEIVIQDPAHGEMRMSYAEVKKHFTGLALELIPSPQFQRRRPKPPIGWRELIGNVVGLKRGLLQMLVLAAALQIFGLIAPFFSQWVVDGAIVSGDKDLIVTLALGFTLLMLTQVIVSVGQSQVGLSLATQMNLQWSDRVMRHLLRLPTSYFETRHVGDIVSRFQSLSAIQTTVSSGFVGSILDGIFAIATGILMFLYSPLLAACVVGALAIYCTIRVLSFRTFRKASSRYIALTARENSHFLESIRGAQSIKIGGLEEHRRIRWFNLLVSATNQLVKTQKLSIGFGASYSVLFGIEQVISLFWGATLVIDGTLSVGMLFAFLSYKDQFSGRMRSFIDRVIELYLLDLHVERLSDIVLTAPETTNGLQGHWSSEVGSGINAGSIEFVNVGFRYGDGEPWVLRKINMKIDAGEHVAIVGPSGCGKSTLVKLMIGLLTPTEGAILVGGISLHQLGLSKWRNCLGVVMQDDQLFTGSLSENIANFDPDIDMKRVEAAAKLAAIHDEIVAMPMGYQTLNGDMGSTLSGGQKQRILLARALYREPSALVLDEATSHLDASREKQVNLAIAHLQRTRVIIAHRTETIAMADRVIDMHELTVMQPKRLAHA